MHWADVVAERLEKRGHSHIIAAGITPSGEFHIGHLREILTGEMIHRACKARGLDTEFVFIVDSADPLRRVYDFLDSSYEKYIGHPLGAIPSPGNDEKSYADYFLEPFLTALDSIGVRPRIIDNFTSYKEGKYSDYAKIACERRLEIKKLIEEISGRELTDEWFPYNPIGSDGSMDGVKVTKYQWPHIEWIDKQGVSGKSDLRKGEGKLPWRIDWPARWGWIGVTCEPFGKDHGTAGGSYDTGKAIAKIMGYDAPEPLTYEWISLKGVGAMSSSAGISIGPIDVMSLVPPEILRYLVARNKPGKHIEFDTGNALIELADEYERLDTTKLEYDENMNRRKKVQYEVNKMALWLSKVEEDHGESIRTDKVTFRHLALLAQIKSNDKEVMQSLFQSNLLNDLENPPKELIDKLTKMRNWINSDHFPNEQRISINLEYDGNTKLSDNEIEFLKLFSSELNNCELSVDDINNAIRNSSKKLEFKLREAFKLLYLLFLKKERGPKLATILCEINKSDIQSCISSFIQNQ